jgi:hypothetical protein
MAKFSGKSVGIKTKKLAWSLNQLSLGFPTNHALLGTFAWSALILIT